MPPKDHLSLYNEHKAAEVAAFFLLRARKEGKNVSKLRLIKWLYLAERRSYELYGEPMIGDRMLSMEHGPVLSNTLYLVENPRHARRREGVWEKNIAVEKSGRHQYMLLTKDSDYTGESSFRHLSRAEEKILGGVWQDYSCMSAQQLETLLHSSKFPEWQWDNQGNRPIELATLLPILGYSAVETAETLEHLHRNEIAARAFAS